MRRSHRIVPSAITYFVEMLKGNTVLMHCSLNCDSPWPQVCDLFEWPQSCKMTTQLVPPLLCRSICTSATVTQVPTCEPHSSVASSPTEQLSCSAVRDTPNRCAIRIIMHRVCLMCFYLSNKALHLHKHCNCVTCAQDPHSSYTGA